MDPGGLACRAGVKLQMKLRDFQGIDVRNQSFEQTMNMIRATPRPWKLSFDMLPRVFLSSRVLPYAGNKAAKAGE